MNLYDIASEYKRDFDSLMELDGLPEDAINDTLEGLIGSLEDKVINTAAYIKNLQAEAEAINQAKKAMGERQSRLENMASRLELYLLQAMEVANVKAVTKSPFFEIKVATNPPSVDVIDESLISKEFFKEKIVISIDKAAIKEKLKNGEEVRGATLKQGKRVVIK